MMAPAPSPPYAPRGFRTALLAGTALIFPALIFPSWAQAQPAPNARPQGGAVVAGSATIGGDAGRTVINQTTDRAAVNWQSFDVGRNQAVQFQQPSTTSVTLNRVISSNPSQIAGQITANGQIAIVNQSGVIFHQGSTVNAAGLVVSTANIANEAFMAGGRMNFNQPGRPDARIENHGTITVREAGLAALVAPQVANHGVIRARMGRVVLAGAETSVVDLHGDGLLSLEVTSPVRQAPGDGQALVTNTGTVTATGGTVVLTAQAVDGIVQDLVRAGGRLAANTDAATGRTGRVVVAGNGGAVRIEGTVSAQGLAAGTRGGDIQILGDRTLVAGTARVDASGRAGGGTIAIGVTPNGAANRRLSQRAGIAPGAEVRSDATERGNGGTVLLNSNEYTVQAGTVSAQGGPQGGNGGFVEVSSGKAFYITGEINLAAGPGGQRGTLLIDPTNLTIVAGASGAGSDDGSAADGVLGALETSGNTTVSNGFINAFSGNLRLEATNTITVNAAISKAQGDLALVVTNPSGVASVAQALTINEQIVLGTGALLLSAPTINVNNLVQVSNAQTITLNTPSVGLSGPIGTVTQGSVLPGGALGRFVGGTLTMDSASISNFASMSLGGDNAVTNVGLLEAQTGTFLLRNTQSLTIQTGITDTGTSFDINVLGDLTINGFLTSSAPVLNARATGNIVLNSGGQIHTPGMNLLAAYDFTTSAVNLAAPGGITTNGTIISGPAVIYTGVLTDASLSAGTGGITMVNGPVGARTLNLNTSGSVTANGFDTGGNPFLSIDTLGASYVGGSLLLVAQNVTTVPLQIAGTVQVGGTMSIRSYDEGINQLTGSVIIAPRLDAQANLGISFTGQNQIQNLGNIDGTSISVANGQSLNVVGTVNSTNGAATLNVAGNLTVASGGSVTTTSPGPTNVTLRASGNIDLQANSVVASNSSPVGGVIIEAGASTAAPTSLTMAGTVGGSTPGPVSLRAGTGGIVQTGGTLRASTLAVQSGGDALLSGAAAADPNSVAVLGGVSAAGSFVLDNGVSDIAVGSGSGGTYAANIFAIRTAGALRVAQASGINAGTRASFRAGSFEILPGSPSGPGSVTAPLIEIAPYDAAGMVVLPGASASQPFQLDSDTLGSINTSTLRLGATTFDGATTATASEIFFPGNYSFPGTLDLRARGDIVQEVGTGLSAGRLTGQAGGIVWLDEPTNSLPVIGDLSAGNSILLRTSGAQSLTGVVSAPSILLTTGGTLVESGGRIMGGTLTLQVAGDASLNDVNAITGLGASNVAGRLEMTNASSELLLPVGRVFFTSDYYDIQQAGNLRIDGTITGTSGRLAASGALHVNGNSAIARTGDLNLNAPVFALSGLLQAAGAINIQAATSASLAGTVGGTMLSIISPSITFSGLNALNAPVRLFLGPNGTTTGSLDTSALSVFGGASANLFGTIAGINGGAAAAAGRRGTQGGVLLSEPPPNPRLYLFNNCPIGAAVCTPVFQFDPYLPPSANPLTQAAVLDPVASLAQQLRPPVPSFSLRLYRDRSEEGELAPPNVRGEDF